MRRLQTMLVSAALLVAVGCGTKSYEFRLNTTLDAMRYRKRLDDKLEPAVKGKLEELLIYVRPPKKMQQTKEFMLTAPPPGMFDADVSLLDASKQSTLHLLARVKRPKAPNAKT